MCWFRGIPSMSSPRVVNAAAAGAMSILRVALCFLLVLLIQKWIIELHLGGVEVIARALH